MNSLRGVFFLLFLSLAGFGARSEPGKFEPELDDNWHTTYGVIHWDEGWYGGETNTIEITAKGWDDDRGAYLVNGKWGRVGNDSYKGTFEFAFSTPVTFSGWWSQDGFESRIGWSGTRKSMTAKPSILEGNDKAEFVPDLNRVWKSSYGNIDWQEGWYGRPEKTITVIDCGWDKAIRKYLVRGYWGRRSNESFNGPFEFQFSDPTSFSGWWSTSGSGSRSGWSGRIDGQQ